jgi:plastocyanin
MRPLAFGLILMTVVGACDTSLEEPSSIDVSLVANLTTVATGDTVTFEVNGRGGNLVGFEIEYGDGESDQLATSGAQTARTTFRHAYETAGSYTALVTMTDAALGAKEASVEIVVN